MSESLTFEDACAIMCVNVTYTKSELNKAYAKLAKEYHPDKNPKNKVYFEIITEAYDLLSALTQVKKEKTVEQIVHERENNTNDLVIPGGMTTAALNHDEFNNIKKEYPQTSTLYNVPDYSVEEDCQTIKNRWLQEKENIETEIPTFLNTDISAEEFNRIFEYNKIKYGAISNNALTSNTDLFASNLSSKLTRVVEGNSELLYNVNPEDSNLPLISDFPEYRPPSKKELEKIKVEYKVKKADKHEADKKYQDLLRERSQAEIVLNNDTEESFLMQKDVENKKQRFKNLLSIKNLKSIGDGKKK